MFNSEEDDTMFRERPDYIEGLKRLTDSIEDYYDTSGGPCGGLEEVMLAAYSLSKTIKTYMSIDVPEYTGKLSVYDAMQRVKHVINNNSDTNSIKPLTLEAQALDVFSRVAYDLLKKENKLSGVKKKQLSWADNEPY